EDEHPSTGIRQQLRQARLLELRGLAELPDPVHRGVDARVHRDPLHPRIEVLLLLRGIGREYTRLIVEALEVRKPAFVYELRDQRRSQFVELEQYDLALLLHDRPLAADSIHSPSHDGVVELAPPISQESSQPSCTA